MSLTAQEYPTRIQIKHILINRDIVQMVRAKVSESTIIEAINANPTNFDISGSGIASLKTSGVSETIIKAMISAVSRPDQQKLVTSPVVSPREQNPALRIDPPAPQSPQ
jgi:hypothetical protein